MIALDIKVSSVKEQELPNKIYLLRQKIHDEDYLYEAIQRIAQVLSNEISGIRRRSA